MTTDIFRQSFHDDAGTQLVLTCEDGSCLVEFATPAATEPAVQLELLLLPRDRRGLPDGPPVELHSQCVPLLSLSERRGMLGRCWLPPGLSVEAVRNCFIRLKPVSSCTERTCK